MAVAAVGGPTAAGLASSFGFAPLSGAGSAVSPAEEGKVDRSGLADTHTRATARLALARARSNPTPTPDPTPTRHPPPYPYPYP